MDPSSKAKVFVRFFLFTIKALNKASRAGPVMMWSFSVRDKVVASSHFFLLWVRSRANSRGQSWKGRNESADIAEEFQKSTVGTLLRRQQDGTDPAHQQQGR